MPLRPAFFSRLQRTMIGAIQNRERRIEKRAAHAMASSLPRHKNPPMESIKKLFPKIEKNTDQRTERGELMRYFLGQINPSRITAGFPKMNYGRLGRMLQGIETKDLYYLKRVCDDSTNFSKRFFWEINPKKHLDRGTSARIFP